MNDLTPINHDLIIYDEQKSKSLWQYCCNISESDIIPKHYQRKPANILVAKERAAALNCSALNFMSHSYLVQGKLGIQGKFIIALLNSSGVLKQNLYWDFDKKNGQIISCTCYAEDKNGKKYEYNLTWEEVLLNKWDQDKKTKEGYVLVSKWKTMRQKMFMYRTAAWLADLYYGHITFGMTTVEALEDEKIVEEIEPEHVEPIDPKEVIESEKETEKTQTRKRLTKDEKKEALIKLIENKISKEDSELFLQYLHEIEILNAPYENYNSLSDEGVKKLNKRFGTITDDFKVYKSVRKQFFDFLNQHFKTEDELNKFNKFLIEKGYKKTVGHLLEINREDLKAIFKHLHLYVEEYNKSIANN